MRRSSAGIARVRLPAILIGAPGYCNSPSHTVLTFFPVEEF
jgi:hypothetical protein